MTARLKRLIAANVPPPRPHTGPPVPGLPVYGRRRNPFPARNMPDIIAGSPGETFVDVPRFNKKQYQKRGFKLARQRAIPLGFASDQLVDDGSGTYYQR